MQESTKCSSSSVPFCPYSYMSLESDTIKRVRMSSRTSSCRKPLSTICNQQSKMSYCTYSASISPQSSPFQAYSQCSFGSDLKIGQPDHFELNLYQQQQQGSQKQHLLQQHTHQLSQSLSSSRSGHPAWSYPLCIALLLAGAVAALLAFTPLGWPVGWAGQRHSSWSSSSTNISHATAAAPTGLIKCRIQQAAGAVSSLCDGDVSYEDGSQAHVTVWRQSTQGLSHTGTSSVQLEDDGGVFGRHRRRQQHRRLLVGLPAQK